MLSSTNDLENLLDVLNQETIPEMTFDQCMQKFSKLFQKNDRFKACSTLCYLIESQVSSNGPVDIAFCLDAFKDSKNRSILHSVRDISSRKRARNTFRSCCLQFPASMRASPPEHQRQ